MTYNYPFETIDVWLIAKELTIELHGIIESFPESEKEALTSRINSTCLRLLTNLAENSTRLTAKEQAQHAQEAYSRAIELMNYLIISKELGYLSEQIYFDLREKIDDFTAKLNGLRKTHYNKIQSQSSGKSRNSKPNKNYQNKNRYDNTKPRNNHSQNWSSL